MVMIDSDGNPVYHPGETPEAQLQQALEGIDASTAALAQQKLEEQKKDK